MAKAASRFRRLPPPRLEPAPERVAAPIDAAPAEASRVDAGPDLFGHFGIDTAHRGVPGPIIGADPCGGCGWLCRADDPGDACPVCGGARRNSTTSG